MCVELLTVASIVDLNIFDRQLVWWIIVNRRSNVMIVYINFDENN